MQSIINDTTLVVALSSAVLILFAVSYIVMVHFSNKRIIDEQQKKIDEVRKSEERYKALFENSLAGMMKFSVLPLIIFEANKTMLEMFNVENVYDLQRVISELPHGQTRSLETALQNAGAVESFEIEFPTQSGMKRRFLVSARREHDENLIHAVIVLMSSEKLIG